MYLIAGLGNPGEEYNKTRHNIGFDVIDKIAEEYNMSIDQNIFQALCGKGEINGEKVMLIKPQTYMNLSGKSIIQFIRYYKIEINKVIIIYDDFDVKVGTIKIRKKGGPGNHKGLKSIVYELGTDAFPRVRVGTGEEEKIDNIIDYVIKKVDDDQYKQLEIGIDKAKEAIIELIKNGIDSAMNKFN